MGCTRKTLVALAFALVSCSAQAPPAATPIQQVVTLRVYSTTETTALLQSLSTAYRQSQPLVAFATTSASFDALAARVLRENGAYFFSHHLPEDIDSPTSPYWAAPIGQDALAVIVHPTNDVPGMTTAQLREVYGGEITRWEALGGRASEIAVITPDASAGLRGEFDASLMGARAISPTAQVVPNEAAMLRTVSRQVGAVGYVSLSALDESVRALPIEGILPTADSVYDSSYPLRTTIYLVGRAEPQDDDYPEMRAFIGWVQSLEGQQIVGQRYAPLLRP
jgi:ABC-type phosphate transport system substrate-binding protein